MVSLVKILSKNSDNKREKSFCDLFKYEFEFNNENITHDVTIIFIKCIKFENT